MKTSTRLLFVIGLTVSFGPVSAQERIVWAQVSSVEPITEVEHRTPDETNCASRAPASSSGLRAILEWDLTQCRARQVRRTTGYRVHYEWGGREYSHISDKIPGHRIPIKVGVEPSF